MERLICSECGLAYEDQRQHTDWHVDRHVARKQREALARMSDAEIIAGMDAALNKLRVNVLDPHWLEVGAGDWEAERG